MYYQNKSLAIIITCHNRKETTLKCLDNIKSQKEIDNIKLHVFLVDDGSTDGTQNAVEDNFQDIEIIKGDGSLFWNGGMAKGMERAIQKGFDFYLWLNDDTMLYDYAIKNLFNTYKLLKGKTGNEPIVAGSLCDPITEKLSYGGYLRNSKWNPLRFKRIKPRDSPKKCHVVNGNIVLLSSTVVQKVGNLHSELQHAFGDFEYCLRASKLGIKSWITSGYLGECPRNSEKGTWKDPSLSLLNRFKNITGTKGQPPYERYIYLSTHGNILWPFYYIGVYLKPLLYKIKKILKGIH